MKVPFKYYLHDGYESRERAAFILEQIEGEVPEGWKDSDEFSEFIGRPFYEVTLDCVLDTETGEVEVVGTKL